MTFLTTASGHCLRNWCSELGYIMTILLFIGCSNPYSKPFTLMSRGGDSAIIELNQMLEKNPQDSIALYARGCTYSNISRFDEAIADFDKVLEINKQYIASATSAKSTSSSTNPTSSEAYKEFLTLSEMSRAASIGVGSRTGLAGSLGALGASGSSSGGQTKVENKQEKAQKEVIAMAALKHRVMTSKSKAESFENAGQIPEARSAYTEFIGFYNNLSPDQQKKDFVNEMYRLSMGKIDKLNVMK